MLQETLLRVKPCAAPVLVVNQALEIRTVSEVSAINITPQKILLEPAGRNTAPALAAAALLLEEKLMLVLPSDHAIRNPDILLQAVEAAAPLAKQGRIICFGIKPRRPATGFGYIRRGPALSGDIFNVDEFIEKPPTHIAKALLRSGVCDWNSGIFLLSAETALAELERFEAGLLSCVENSVRGAGINDNLIRLSPVFAQAPSLSIDVALMERSEKTLVMPVELDWCDLGTWPAVLGHVFQKA